MAILFPVERDANSLSRSLFSVTKLSKGVENSGDWSILIKGDVEVLYHGLINFNKYE